MVSGNLLSETAFTPSLCSQIAFDNDCKICNSQTSTSFNLASSVETTTRAVQPLRSRMRRGGGERSLGLGQIKAEITGRRIVRRDGEDGNRLAGAAVSGRRMNCGIRGADV